ncbi:MAG: RluA family pseudouridine synthase [Nitriliruptorales bacterium]|nr:RluA family pseudouridine synthase [Nitriliruptorales bacterium]
MAAQGRRFVVPVSHDGERLDVTLSALLEESRSQAAARIERGEVQDASGAPLSKSHRVAGGEEIDVLAPPVAPTGADGVAPPPVRYEDEHLLVVDKPSGLVVHPGAGHSAGTMVQALAAAEVPLAAAGGDVRPGIVHRLDRDTSGLLAVAKTDAAFTGLVAALKAREVDRRYLALVEGEFDVPTVRIEVPLGRDPSSRKRFAARPDGKPAVTHVEQLDVGRAEAMRVALLACRLETGRTHQIRVHVSYAGHPVVGDLAYGAAETTADALALTRLFLHAASLRFSHPVTGAEIAVESPLPEDLRAALGRAGLTAP